MHRKEKKMRENHGKKGIIYAENLVKALLCAYLVTGMFLLILALLLYKAGLSEENVNLGIILIYVIGTFSGGFVMGKLEGQKKFLWGTRWHPDSRMPDGSYCTMHRWWGRGSCP